MSMLLFRTNGIKCTYPHLCRKEKTRHLSKPQQMIDYNFLLSTDKTIYGARM